MNKIQVTAQQRANALDALNNMWPSVPAKNVVRGLKVWRGGREKDKATQPSCGSVACFGGWCAWWPNFKAQGLQVDDRGMPYVPGAERSAAVVLFGHFGLFYARGNGYQREEMDRGFVRGTDHQLVTHRLKWLIENSEVVS